MLRNIFVKTLRDNRAGIGIVGMAVALIMFIGAAAFPALYSGSAVQRAQAAAELTSLLQSFSVIYGQVVPITTVGAFLTVRYLSFMPVFIGLWAVIVAAGLIRGEEEQGALDILLTTPHSRVAVFGQKLAALGLGFIVILVLTGLGLLAGVAAIQETIPFASILAVLVNLGLASAFWAAAALFGAQLLATRRTTSTLVGGLLFATYLVDNLVEGLSNLSGIAWVLPFHYYAINKPLVPGRTVDYGAWVVLAMGTLVLLGLALWMFVRRDLGSTFAVLPARRTGQAPRAVSTGGSPMLLGSVFAKGLRDLIGATLGWGLALGAFGALLVGTATQVLGPLRDVVKSIPALAAVMGTFASNEGYLAGVLFELPLFLTFFALLQIGGWADDEASGRMELLVGEPLPRVQILLAHYGAVVCSLAGILLLLGAGILGTAAIANTPLDPVRVLAMLVGAGVVTLVVLAFGLALATWLKQPGAALPITGGVAGAMFIFELLAQVFTWPEAVRNISIYHLYGQPLLQGLAWGNFVVLVAVTLLLAGGSLVGFARRDIAK